MGRADGEVAVLLKPYISDVDLGWDELIDEGFDPRGGTGLGPVYWRIVMRASERFYISTFFMPRANAVYRYGEAVLKYCDPKTGMVPVRIESRLPELPRTDSPAKPYFADKSTRNH
jgi:hypothetical protein